MRPSKISRNKLIKLIYLMLGLIIFIIGIIGLILPVLPGIALMIISLPFIAKGSPRLHKIILENKLYKLSQEIGLRAPKWLKIIGIIITTILSFYIYFKFLS